jgi:hypothetical protein
MSATTGPWTEPRGRRRMALWLVWWLGGALGGLIGGLLPHPLVAAAVAAALVGLFQALAFRPDLRYGAAWFGATAAAGAVGFGAMVLGALAFAGAAGGDPAIAREGLLTWIALGAAGGLLLAAAQAPLTGRPGLAASWCLLGLIGGGVLWTAGLAIGRRFGPELASALAAAVPQLSGQAAGESLAQAAGFALAWLLHGLPFGLIVAGASGDDR